MAYSGGGDTAAWVAGGRLVNPRNGKARKPVTEKTKAISYTSGAISDNILAISKEVSGTGAEAIPKAIRLSNTGGTPLIIMTGYETFTDATTSANNVQYLHTMLLPGESFNPPVRAAISNHTDKFLLDGTALDNQAPNSNVYDDSDANLAAHVDSPDTTISVDNGSYFRVGDLIQLGDDNATATKLEVMEVTAIADPGADGLFTPATLTVKRALYGSNLNDKDAQTDGTDGSVSGANVYLPFFNAYHDFDKYSVSQTDHNGKYKCFNLFGQGRNIGAVDSLSGITPGSLCLKFYTEGGYQNFGMSGITNASITGLATGTEYKINLTVDGGTVFENLAFTTDSSNLRFGGTNGLIEKIQSALDTQFYTAGHLFEKSVIFSIVGGDLRFSSGSNLSTTAILLAAPTSGTTPFGVGRIPAIGSIRGAVASSLPEDVIYDPITYAQIPNSSAFAYDDGRGNISGAAKGKISYETGSIDFRGPINSEFVYSVIHSGPFSGKLDSEDTHKTALTDIYANTTSQKWNGKIKLETW